MHDPQIDITPFFLESQHGQLFCLYVAPAENTASQGIIYLHPFAEEMHKSRRMAALQARAFARAGYAVLQVDLTGCGDSSGDFCDASWEIWHSDVRLAHDWLTTRISGPISLWGLRIGASLAVDVSPTLSNISRLLLWQPVINGNQFLKQFLRIKLASEILSESQSQTGTKNMLLKLEAGEAIEIGGYLLSPAMARGLAKLNLSQASPSCSVEWIEIGAVSSASLTPSGESVVKVWRGAGLKMNAHTVQGERFWITQEITECPKLLEATSAAILR